ncbi:aminomethyl-transferring glycine dehydrogenase subunit GcvPA [Stygiolobus caldivivus]|uniref:Probable glycine dehydrogenase (decarboxylating) subunit 1 n=1 Tax=Stygiolobus caldivivus TaxID=2824673 RepID=A0A8D5U964_9CREN|nr:aminomethyl-transferring glycine dehydrogenase subunit GcvPA [Stygiolobus caldivivus]BCU71242.1 glycine dehydrogenase [Stygiolobus caldivivus]
MEMHPWLPNLASIKEMLEVIGVNDIYDLFSDVPNEILLKGDFDLPYKEPLSEYEITLRLKELKSKNMKLLTPPFMGGGECPHYVPEAVKFIISRSEFYTSYTPYQPEITQGLLQALFEYQSLIAELFELEVVNASLYDWGSALAEAVMMANRINKKTSIAIPANINPYHKEVLKTWVYGKGLKIIEIPYDKYSGELDYEKAKEIISSSNDISAIYIQQPNYYGVFEEEIETITDYAKKVGAISIMGVNPLSLGLIKPPGEYEIDIAVSDGQELGLPLNYGGPLVGIMATRWDGQLVRQMPGRIVGLTKDSNGNKAFTLILQTREQFARREKATSNITTNEALMAIANAVFLSLLGKHGLKAMAEEIYARSHYTKQKLESIKGVTSAYQGDFFEEFALRFPIDYSLIHSHLLKRGILGGIQIGKSEALFCVTEVHTKKMIDTLISEIKEVIESVEAS